MTVLAALIKVLRMVGARMMILFILCISTNSASSPAKEMDPLLQEEYCKNFTYGNPSKHELYSPSFPHNYPAGIKCFRTISADYGYFVRVDFRDYFNIEPPSNEGNCDYDYLEVGRDVIDYLNSDKIVKHEIF